MPCKDNDFYHLFRYHLPFFVIFAGMNTESNYKEHPHILLIYTGGTIGMVRNEQTGALESFNFDLLLEQVPELRRFDLQLDTYTFQPPIDSSDMDLSHWGKLVKIISNHYDQFDGFVILHGTDTMAYTASALSFMLENVTKPVILTGSQLPIGTLRTDGKENLITAIEIAAAKREDGTAMVPEVCIYFNGSLMRGNRTTKINVDLFNAFRSYNYPELATVGINIKYNLAAIRLPNPMKQFKPHLLVDPNVVVLTLFPGIQQTLVHAILTAPGLKAVVLRSFGSGNANRQPWFAEEIKEASQHGIVFVNITQCQSGSVHMGLYETSLALIQAGVISGYDSTYECAIAKLMFLLGHGLPPERVRQLMDTNLAGEITKFDKSNANT